jgi:hypothetical protein
MTLVKNRRTAGRVEFARGINVQIVAIDGTWRRQCTMQDVSETGAKLKIEGAVEKLDLKEFFLILSSTGLAFRRCELAWINDDQIGARFLKNTETKKPGKRAFD